MSGIDMALKRALMLLQHAVISHLDGALARGQLTADIHALLREAARSEPDDGQEIVAMVYGPEVYVDG